MIEKNLFRNVHHQTALLESLNWDETQLTALFEYLHTVFHEEILKQPEEIKKNIAEVFGDQTAVCFTKILNEVMFSSNLHLGSNDYEA